VDTEGVDGGAAAWCRRWLGAEPVEELFRAGYSDSDSDSDPGPVDPGPGPPNTGPVDPGPPTPAPPTPGMPEPHPPVPGPPVGERSPAGMGRVRSSTAPRPGPWNGMLYGVDVIVAAGLRRLAGGGRPGEAATLEQSEQFLIAYEQARGRPWTTSERRAGWAAGLWVRAFNAKKERMNGGGPQLDRLAKEMSERSARAGLGA
jgi:hypothetical protein